MLVKIQSGSFSEGQTSFPVELVKQGISPFPVGQKSGGKVIPVWVNWSEDAIGQLVSELNNRKTLKVYNGHITEQQLAGALHRDVTDWIATVQGPYGVMADESGKPTVVGMVKVHTDTPVGAMLLNRIYESPEEVKFSLDYSAKMTQTTIEEKKVLDVQQVGRIRSLDFVPESGYDNGMYMPNLMQSAIEAIDNYKEEKKMDLATFKTEHPGLYQSILEDGVEKGKAEIKVVDTTEYKEVQQSLKAVSEEKDALKAENDTLKAEVEDLKQANIEKEKQLAIVEETKRGAYADAKMQEILASSAIPESLYEKVKSMVDWRKFADDKFEVDSESFKKFTDAFQTEVNDWETKLNGKSIINNNEKKDDKVKQSAYDQKVAEFDDILSGK